MRHRLEWLSQHQEKGLLGYEMGLPTTVQYWTIGGASKRGSERGRAIHPGEGRCEP
jgi:hypothetical protein